MKYGETLRQRSIPEWVYYNIDYDEIKHLIKENTTPGKGKAVSIPGQGQSAEREFENGLYGILSNEHDRIGLFVKSKSLEIQRRLELLDRKLRHLQLRNKLGQEERPDRYGRLEQEAIKAGEEIQSLSRFIGAQRLAFKKLLKKYKKWTGSDALETRFKLEVLGRPTSFVQVSLNGQLDDWSDALQIIRAAQDPDATNSKNLSVKSKTGNALSPSPQRGRPRQRSEIVAGQLGTTVATGSDVDFDAAFHDAPIGGSGTKAVYWIHQEQLIELQVVLLQLLRLYVPKPALGTSSSTSQSPVITRRSSLSRRDSQLDKENHCGVIALDKLDDYAKRQTKGTVSDSEESFGRSLAKPALLARWTSAEEAIVSLRQPDGFTSPGSTRVRKKYLGTLLNIDGEFSPEKCSCASPSTQPNDSLTPTEVRNLLCKHAEIQPLVGIFSKRTRFVGLSNISSIGQWCVLDSHISFCKVQRDELIEKDWATNIGRDTTPFPFSVLQVRQEGPLAKSIIDILDKSHLTERVRGFTLAHHAIWECHHPTSMTPPLWLPALQRDIRKVPQVAPRSRRKGVQVQTITQKSSNSSELDPSGSSTAVTGESSATSVPTTPVEPRDFNGILPSNKQRRVTYHQDAILKHQAKKAAQSEGPRYWSEYDHPEDGSDDGNAYYLYIDPTASDKFPGQETAEILYARLKALFSKQKHALTDDVESQRRPLLAHTLEDDEASSSPTDTDEETPRKSLSTPRTYGTTSRSHSITPHQKLAPRPREFLPSSAASAPQSSTSSRWLIVALSLAASSVICVIIGTLAATGRNKLRGEVDAGVLFGVVASLFFALVGMVSVVMAKERMSVINWLIVSTVFVAVCVADGALIGFVV